MIDGRKEYKMVPACFLVFETNRKELLMEKKVNKKTEVISRRSFMKASAAVSLAALGSSASRIFAAGSDKIRVGVIGCGLRGTVDARDCIKADCGAEIVAMGDLFKDKLDESLENLKSNKGRYEGIGGGIKVTEETCFAGWDAYKKVLATDVDMVILATPPHFRPEHFKAAVEAGKHVFMQKPVAVDPVGVRSVLATSELAAQKDLSVVAGTQRRHQGHYLEIMKRIHDGAIGRTVGGECFWNGGGSEAKSRKPEWSEMEYQIRNWQFFNWLSGDHIVEQHVHNIDVINWALKSHPVKVVGIGGRQVRSSGNIYDHFAVDFEYPNGERVLSMCRQIPGCSERVSERLIGTKGTSYTDLANGSIEGENAFEYDGPSPDPYVQEQIDMITSIRQDKPINEGRAVAESTLTAIMGRMSAYTGKELSWNWVMNASELDMRPAKYELGDMPIEPVAMPGKTKLV